MIIHTIEAHNFLAHKYFDSGELPSSGVISITGNNESGKSSIGEMISYALFGRSTRIPSSDEKLITWGQSKMSVTLSFSHHDQRYHIIRGHVRGKRATAGVYQEGQSKPIVEGHQAVTEWVNLLLNYDYDSFVNSFFLTGQQISTPKPDDKSFKKMSGIGQFALLHHDYMQENQQLRLDIEQMEPKVVELKNSLDDMAIDERFLPDLLETDETLQQTQMHINELTDQLNEVDDSYAEESRIFKGLNKKHHVFKFIVDAGAGVLFLLAVFWLAWLFFRQHMHDFLLNTFSIQTSAIAENIPLLAVVSVTFLLVWLVIWLLSRNYKAGIKYYSTLAKQRDQAYQAARVQVTEAPAKALPEKAIRTLKASHQQFSNSDGGLLSIVPASLFANHQQMTDQLGAYTANAEDVYAYNERLRSAMQNQTDELQKCRGVMQVEVDKEHLRVKQTSTIRSEMHITGRKIATKRVQMMANDKAIELLGRASKQNVENFNQSIQHISSDVLPHFTQQKYKKMRISEALQPEVFDDKQSTFIAFDSLSSGTQRQVLLALRIALSEQLSRNSQHASHFLFLDEPFAFFDEYRTESTIHALSDVSPILEQVFIASQHQVKGFVPEKHVQV